MMTAAAADAFADADVELNWTEPKTKLMLELKLKLKLDLERCIKAAIFMNWIMAVADRVVMLWLVEYTNALYGPTAIGYAR